MDARAALRLRLGLRPRHAAALAVAGLSLEVERLEGAVRHLARRNTVAVWLSESMTLGCVGSRALCKACKRLCLKV